MVSQPASDRVLSKCLFVMEGKAPGERSAKNPCCDKNEWSHCHNPASPGTRGTCLLNPRPETIVFHSRSWKKWKERLLFRAWLCPLKCSTGCALAVVNPRAGHSSAPRSVCEPGACQSEELLMHHHSQKMIILIIGTTVGGLLPCLVMVFLMTNTQYIIFLKQFFFFICRNAYKLKMV